MFSPPVAPDRTGNATGRLGSSKIAVRLVAACVLLQAVPARACENPGNGSGAAGCRMFFGETPLQGDIIEHDRPLPPEVVACANCHLEDTRSTSGGSFAPSLNRSMLTEPRRRRGGPPSQFSAVSFCRLLRTGIDPAYIVISRKMPRYVLDDEQCLDLWQYLLEQSDAPHKSEE
jgi:hypothetical protein